MFRAMNINSFALIILSDEMTKNLGNVIRTRLIDEKYPQTGPRVAITAIHAWNIVGWAAEILII